MHDLFFVGLAVNPLQQVALTWEDGSDGDGDGTGIYALATATDIGEELGGMATYDTAAAGTEVVYDNASNAARRAESPYADPFLIRSAGLGSETVGMEPLYATATASNAAFEPFGAAAQPFPLAQTMEPLYATATATITYEHEHKHKHFGQDRTYDHAMPSTGAQQDPEYDVGNAHEYDVGDACDTRDASDAHAYDVGDAADVVVAAARPAYDNVAGVLGSTSGNPASTFPTLRRAPTTQPVFEVCDFDATMPTTRVYDFDASQGGGISTIYTLASAGPVGRLNSSLESLESDRPTDDDLMCQPGRVYSQASSADMNVDFLGCRSPSRTQRLHLQLSPSPQAGVRSVSDI